MLLKAAEKWQIPKWLINRTINSFSFPMTKNLYRMRNKFPFRRTKYGNSSNHQTSNRTAPQADRTKKCLGITTTLPARDDWYHNLRTERNSFRSHKRRKRTESFWMLLKSAIHGILDARKIAHTRRTTTITIYTRLHNIREFTIPFIQKNQCKGETSVSFVDAEEYLEMFPSGCCFF